MAKIMSPEKILQILNAIGLDVRGQTVTKVVITFEANEAPIVEVRRLIPDAPVDFLALKRFELVERTRTINDG